MMKVRSALFCALLLSLLPAQAFTPARATFDSPQSFASELRHLRQSLETTGAKAVIGKLPDEWIVQTPEATYSISTHPFRVGSPADAKTWLDNLAFEAEHYDRNPQVSRTARPALQRILEQPQFGKDRSPSSWDLLRVQIDKWIKQMIRRLFAVAGENPAVSQGLFWILIVGACGALAFFLYRWRRQRSYRLQQATGPQASPRTWERWIADALAAAHDGNIREAIQLAYWGAVAKLQDSDALPRTSAHTPREYLHLLTTGNSGIAHSAGRPLRALTGQLEKFWYAQASPAPDDFAESLKSLEEIGCRVS